MTAAPTSFPHQEVLPSEFASHGGFSGYIPHNNRLMPAFTPPSSQPVSSVAGLAEYTQLALRVERLLEQENIHLRHVQAEQRAELNILRDVISKAPAEPQASVPAQEATPSADVAEFLQHIRAEQSLLPHEQPGEDHIQYWQQHSWKAKKNAKKGKTTIGQVHGKRGKSRIAKGENVKHPYLEQVNGEPVDGHYLMRIGSFTRHFINSLKQSGRLAPSWKEVDMPARELWFAAARKKFPIFQLCEFNWKADSWMSHQYYEATRSKRKAKPEVQERASLDDARTNIERVALGVLDVERIALGVLDVEHFTLGVLDVECRALSIIDVDRHTLGIVHIGSQTLNHHTLRLIAINCIGPHKPPNHPQPQRVITTLAIAAVAALSFATCWRVHTAHSSAVDRSRILFTEATTAPPSTTTGPTSRVSDRAGAPLSPPSGPNAPTATATAPGTAACTNVAVPHSETAALAAQCEPDKDTPPATEATGSAGSKPRKKMQGPQSTKPWPPSETETQPKWICARNWLKLHPEGTRAAFEQHYAKELTTNEKRKFSRQLSKPAKTTNS
ncbi:hypothetical protein OH77DRAFT_1525874 [Trametes cingulata]|nr:hypothetical protein OH77DRAFT_1525874 [Trametes cingulata]